MRTIAVETLKLYWNKNKPAEQPLKAWYKECSNAKWNSAAELKTQFRSCSIINSKRAVFNIKGNDFRLIVDIEYRLKIVFIVWVGTHKQYNNIDAKTVKYVKTNKK